MQGLGGAADDIHLLKLKSVGREIMEQAGVWTWKHSMFMQGWVSPVYSQILRLHMLEVLWGELKDKYKVRKKRYFPGAPSSSISIAMRGSCTGLWADRRFLLTAWAGSIWLSKCVWFKGLSWYPASTFQQVPIVVLHLSAWVMGQVLFLCALRMCSCSMSNTVKLDPELRTSPRTYMLWQK